MKKEKPHRVGLGVELPGRAIDQGILHWNLLARNRYRIYRYPLRRYIMGISTIFHWVRSMTTFGMLVLFVAAALTFLTAQLLFG